MICIALGEDEDDEEGKKKERRDEITPSDFKSTAASAKSYGGLDHQIWLSSFINKFSPLGRNDHLTAGVAPRQHLSEYLCTWSATKVHEPSAAAMHRDIAGDHTDLSEDLALKESC